MKLLLFSIIICTAVTLNAQNASTRRHIIVLDITKSMEGYQNRTPNIWSKVINYLESFVEKNLNDGDELVLYTYGTVVRKDYTGIISGQSKKEFVANLRDVKTEVVYTCTYEALSQIFKTLDPDIPTSIHLWTDGNNNCPSIDKNATEIIKSFKMQRGADHYWFYNTLGVEVDGSIRQASYDDDRIIIQKGDDYIEKGAKKLVQLRPKYTTFIFNEANLKVKHGGFHFVSGSESDVTSVEIDPLSIRFSGLEERSDIGVDIKIKLVPTSGDFDLTLIFTDGYLEQLKLLGKDYIEGSFNYKSIKTDKLDVTVVPEKVSFRFDVKKKTFVKINFPNKK